MQVTMSSPNPTSPSPPAGLEQLEAAVSALAATAIPNGEGTTGLRSLDLLGLSVLLEVYVQDAGSVTRAHGAAIALDNGTGAVCRATYADAPGVGVRVERNAGICGRCLATGEPVLWSAGEHATSGTASVVAVPIGANGKTAGLLAAFSHTREAFGPGDVAALTRIANDLAEHLVLLASETITEPDIAGDLLARLDIDLDSDLKAAFGPPTDEDPPPASSGADIDSTADPGPPHDLVFSAAQTNVATRSYTVVMITLLIAVLVVAVLLALEWHAKRGGAGSPVSQTFQIDSPRPA